MAHGIIKPYDQVLSTEGTEWHQLATQVEAINAKTVKPLLFPIVEGEIVIAIDGTQVPMNNHKALVADLRGRKDLIGTGDDMLPLHIPKNSYRPIENGEVWEAMEKSLAELDAKITCAGTLEGCKKFFISVAIGQNNFAVNGDKFLANLNFITSHDGTLAMEAYDSTVRIVCMNTLRWSRQAAGDVKFQVFHTNNANMKMKNLGKLVNAVLTGRKEFVRAMQELNKVKLNTTEMTKIIAGYFVMGTGNEELSTRSSNAVEEIVRLAHKGQGNRGQTAYDLLNGVTEYYTSGDGVGKDGKGDAVNRLYKANFALPAQHKNDICDALMSPETRRDLMKLGERAALSC
jgi:phage/plasmid-like protein (TIGR03299 family)